MHMHAITVAVQEWMRADALTQLEKKDLFSNPFRTYWVGEWQGLCTFHESV